MALRADDHSSNLALPGFSYLWQDAEKSPGYEWEQRKQLSEVGVLVRNSISMTELLREVDQQNRREAAQMRNLKENPANKNL